MVRASETHFSLLLFDDNYSFALKAYSEPASQLCGTLTLYYCLSLPTTVNQIVTKGASQTTPMYLSDNPIMCSQSLAANVHVADPPPGMPKAAP